MTNYAELPDEQINELVATKVMKWHKVRDLFWFDEQNKFTGYRFDGLLLKYQWNPIYDLNQCYQAEETEAIKCGHWWKYAESLSKLLSNGELYWMRRFDYIHANARTRCIAMLMAVEDE